MKLAESQYGTIIYGKVIKLKPGSGNASNRLTIITLGEINYEGKDTGRAVKVLCWNSDKNERANLSDKARKLLPGQIITARVVFDIGDPDKATAFELKKKGLYRLTTNENEEKVVVCGKIAKTISSDNFFGAYIPVDCYKNNERLTRWYLVSFFGNMAEMQKKFIGKGDMIFATGKSKEVTLGDKKFVQVVPTFVKSISQ